MTLRKIIRGVARLPKSIAAFSGNALRIATFRQLTKKQLQRAKEGKADMHRFYGRDKGYHEIWHINDQGLLERKVILTVNETEGQMPEEDGVFIYAYDPQTGKLVKKGKWDRELGGNVKVYKSPGGWKSQKKQVNL